MLFRTIFFDLDDTLYPPNSGLWNAIRDRMVRYMIERLNISPELVPELRKSYFETYGTTLKGLQIHYQINTDEFLAYVHDLPLHEYLKPDPELRRIILSLPQNKWIFTNADDAHARRVINQLELTDCFYGIIDIKATEFICKPELRAYQMALSLTGEDNPSKCVLIEDSPRNIRPARELGFYTILLGKENDNIAHLTLDSLHELPHALPELWGGN